MLGAVKPKRRDVPLPPFPPGLSWLRGAEPVSERVTARGPLIVHFFEVGELSSVRTLPFVASLHERFASSGLTVIGVHSPRNDLAASDEDLDAALERLGIDFPVANDSEHRIWHAYGCEGWPSTFVWRRGGILRWAHFGEGAYHETEAEIREELEAINDGGLPGSVLGEPAGGPAPELVRPSDGGVPGRPPRRRLDGRVADESLVVEYSGAGAWAALSGSGEVERNRRRRGVRADRRRRARALRALEPPASRRPRGRDQAGRLGRGLVAGLPARRPGLMGALATAALAALALALPLGGDAARARSQAPGPHRSFGHSVEGRDLVARRVGPGDGPADGARRRRGPRERGGRPGGRCRSLRRDSGGSRPDDLDGRDRQPRWARGPTCRTNAHGVDSTGTSRSAGERSPRGGRDTGRVGGRRLGARSRGTTAGRSRSPNRSRGRTGTSCASWIRT